MASGIHTLGKNIAKFRQDQDLSQDDLSDKAGISYSTLSKIEQGSIKQPSIFTVYDIARALGVTLDQLIHGRIDADAGDTQGLKSPSDIKFIYFDVNGVLVKNWEGIFTSIAEQFQLEPEKVELAFWRYNDIANRGNMTIEEFESALASSLGFKAEEFDFSQNYFDSIQPLREAHELAKSLCDNYKIGLVTNTFPGFLPRLIKDGLVPNLPYEVKVESCEIGSVKPEDQIFDYAQKISGFQPSQILFVDDSHANVEVARHHGWNAIYFNTKKAQHTIKQIETLLNH